MRKSQDIGDRIRDTMKMVTEWCRDTGLYLAQEKTEVILLTVKRVSKIFKFDVGGAEITTKNSVKYLLDNARGYSSHLEQVCNKAEKFVGACCLTSMGPPTP
jgi:hypothetical protein